MEQDNIILQREADLPIEDEFNSEEDKFVSDLQINRLRQIGRESFRWEPTPFMDYYKMVKESAKFYNFNLPQEFNKIFINYQNAYIFWIYKSPLMDYVDDYFRVSLLKGGKFDTYKHLKEFFIKWIVLRSKEDRKFYASSTINYIEKDISKKNFVNQIIQAVIYIYEESVYNPEKAISILENAKSTIESLKLDEYFKSELIYLLEIFKGFLFLKEGQSNLAASYFQNALAIFPQAITPKFHLSLCEIYSDNIPEAANYFKEVIQSDIERLNYAITTNKYTVFTYLLEHNNTRNIFDYPEFAAIFDSIEEFADENKGRGNMVVSDLREKIQLLKDQKRNNFYNDQIVNNLTFLDKLTYNFTHMSDTLFAAVSPYIEDKFDKTVRLIGESIKAYHFEEADKALLVFGHGLKEQARVIERLRGELEEFKIKLKNKLAASIETYEKNISANIQFLESKAENIHLVSGLDPKVSLKNNFNYNIIISLMIFLVGGFASYSSNSISDISEFRGIISMVFIVGIKWASISFFLGLIISFFIAGSVVLERTTQKQKFMHRISLLKNEKERVVKQLHEEAREREKIQVENLEKRMEIHKRKIDELNKEHESRKHELYEAAKVTIRVDFEQLNPLISDPMKI